MRGVTESDSEDRSGIGIVSGAVLNQLEARTLRHLCGGSRGIQGHECVGIIRLSLLRIVGHRCQPRAQIADTLRQLHGGRRRKSGRRCHGRRSRRRGLRRQSGCRRCRCRSGKRRRLRSRAILVLRRRQDGHQQNRRRQKRRQPVTGCAQPANQKHTGDDEPHRHETEPDVAASTRQRANVGGHHVVSFLRLLLTGSCRQTVTKVKYIFRQ